MISIRAQSNRFVNKILLVCDIIVTVSPIRVPMVLSFIILCRRCKCYSFRAFEWIWTKVTRDLFSTDDDRFAHTHIILHTVDILMYPGLNLYICMAMICNRISRAISIDRWIHLQMEFIESDATWLFQIDIKRSFCEEIRELFELPMVNFNSNKSSIG